jgi:release factor glutamine methyltransferase
MPSIEALLARGTARLRAAGIENPRFEARLLLEQASGLDRATTLAASRDILPAEAILAFDELLDRRAAREPIAYILGVAPFWSLELTVGPSVLIPRADTETLVGVALAVHPDRLRVRRLLDLGTGSGCLALALLSEFPRARAVATDIDPEACAMARANARSSGFAARIRILCTSWADGVAGTFDLVVANPPYVERAAIAQLQPEVALFEPVRALDGGPDGLDAYRALVPQLPRLLETRGVALIEIGLGQAEAVRGFATAAGLAVQEHRDLGGIVRCLELRPRPDDS